jgi:hypothetical protein
VQVVGGRVLEDERARGHLDVGLDELEQGALGRGVGAHVEQRGLHVGEPAQRVEVVPVVVVERLLVAEPLPHGVGIRVDDEVEGVVVQLGIRHEIHVTLWEEDHSQQRARRPGACASG